MEQYGYIPHDTTASNAIGDINGHHLPYNPDSSSQFGPVYRHNLAYDPTTGHGIDPHRYLAHNTTSSNSLSYCIHIHIHRHLAHNPTARNSNCFTVHPDDNLYYRYDPNHHLHNTPNTVDRHKRRHGACVYGTDHGTCCERCQFAGKYDSD